MPQVRAKDFCKFIVYVISEVTMASSLIQIMYVCVYM